jgi:antirestriction protein ArdC
MKQKKIRTMIDSAVEELASELESGGSRKLQRYLKAMAKFHRYSLRNVLLIHRQKPEATHVAGYRTWQKLGRQVKKGESGIYILAPITKRRTEKDDDTEEDGPNGRDEKGSNIRTKVVGFTTACVFDIGQTKGEPLPEPAKVKGRPGQLLEKLKDFAGRRNIEIEYPAHLRVVQGTSSGGKVQIRPDLKPAEEFSTLAHELAHEILHAQQNHKKNKTIEETEAEAVAHVVCHAADLDVNTSSSDYIQIYQGDTKTLTSSLRRIRRAARAMIEHILPDKRSAPLAQRAAD